MKTRKLTLAIGLVAIAALASSATPASARTTQVVPNGFYTTPAKVILPMMYFRVVTERGVKKITDLHGLVRLDCNNEDTGESYPTDFKLGTFSPDLTVNRRGRVRDDWYDEAGRTAHIQADITFNRTRTGATSLVKLSVDSQPSGSGATRAPESCKAVLDLHLKKTARTPGVAPPSP